MVDPFQNRRQTGASSGLTRYERLYLARLSAGRIVDRIFNGGRASAMFRSRVPVPVSDEILLVPRGLRTADPSFATELKAGMVGLAGETASMADGTIWGIACPSAGYASALHGFAWLRHLTRAADADSGRFARDSVQSWIRTHGQPFDQRQRSRFVGQKTSASAVVWDIEVSARRLMSWLTNAPLLLDDVEPDDFDRLLGALSLHMAVLARCWRHAPDGQPRLTALIALATGAVCLSGQDTLYEAAIGDLARELSAQIMADGGHISRDPGVGVGLLLDLLPLRTCMMARRKPTNPGIEAALHRALAFLRFIRLGDGSIARFNGMGATELHSLATVLGYDRDDSVASELVAPQSRYARLAAGNSVLLADVGSPPPLELAGAAAAGCLSFELSVGNEAVLVNSGRPGRAKWDDLLLSRSTAGHNALVVAASSSGRLIRDSLAERVAGSPPLAGPDQVTYNVNPGISEAGSVVEPSSGTATSFADRTNPDVARAGGHTEGRPGPSLTARHSGYLQRHNLIHERQIALSADGQRLDGRDRLAGPSSTPLRLKRDLPFAVHFHLAPGLVTKPTGKPNSIEIVTRAGKRLLFEVDGAMLTVEECRHLSAPEGPRPSRQIVLRGATFGETTVTWSMVQVGDAAGSAIGDAAYNADTLREAAATEL